MHPVNELTVLESQLEVGTQLLGVQVHTYDDATPSPQAVATCLDDQHLCQPPDDLNPRLGGLPRAKEIAKSN